MLVLTNQNNFCRFMKTKSLSSCQVRWAQELLQYHFWVNYCQGKANRAADALSQFFQRSDNKKDKFQAENSQIFHQLQSSLTNASLSGLSLLGLNTLANLNLFPLHQFLICATHDLPQLRQFWDTFCLELAIKSPYKASNDRIQLRPQELQETNSKAQELRQQGFRNGLY